MKGTIADGGVGVLLLHEYAEALLAAEPALDFIEVMPENWARFGGRRRRIFDACRERWPAVGHSISLSVGGPEPLDDELLRAVAGLGLEWWSDHLCFGRIGGGYTHALLPLPHSEEAAAHVVGRVQAVQARLGRELVLENVATYARLPDDALAEPVFVRTVIEEADCGLLLDIGNVLVNAHNHGLAPEAYVDALPLARVREIHVAGHRPRGSLLIDDHTGPVPEAVWSLYRWTIRKAGRAIPTIVEWETDLPPVEVLLAEVARARRESALALEGL
ncbi:DUF692 domain-containing protein [Nannocystis bainbridge]|uniref:DUF692 domain-containing protein n=1 Tax=Nannocystis bainbridge TaxID=2995303 RepID=A0ABT5E6A8_9BACT|nr:DUF692 domain-containing protein [Nannocystis bainbridge]MDC0721384.1 DUF692 domain-containing protein [Nannocystis bainbridge]